MRTRSLVLCLALLVAACDSDSTTTLPPPPPPPPPIPEFSLFGQVLALSGTPLAGARIQVTGGTATQTSSVVSDGDGRWMLSGLRGSIFLETWKPGYFPASVCCPSSHDPLGITFRLEQGQRIAVGDTVPGSLGLGPQRCFEGFLEAACHIFIFTPEISGTIEVAVTWDDPVDVLVTLSTLTFEASAPPAPRGRRVLEHSVTAGESYEIRVASLSNLRAYELKIDAR